MRNITVCIVLCEKTLRLISLPWEDAGAQPDPLLPDVYSLNFKLLVVGLEVYGFSFKRFLLDSLVPGVYNFYSKVCSPDA